MKTRQIKGTLDIHSVVTLTQGEIAVRNTSGLCSNCFINGEFHPSCDGWRVFNLPSTPTQAQPSQESQIAETDSVEVDKTRVSSDEPIPDHDSNDITAIESDPVSTVVAAIYQKKRFIGKVLEYDPTDTAYKYHITFMETGKRYSSSDLQMAKARG